MASESIDTILVGDARDILPTMASNYFHSLVTDAPYELGFMGKSWDRSGVAFDTDLWLEAWRVLRPGAWLLAFGGTRTHHRMVSAIEDAGFEIRDEIDWIYGNGFPKSLDIGKAVDEIEGRPRRVIDRRDVGHDITSGGFRDGKSERKIQDITVGDGPWEGWGTALKPAHEPICVARKPLADGMNVAQNVLAHQTGGINIDASRIETTETWHRDNKNRGRTFHGKAYDERGNSESHPKGRYPTNLILDETAAGMLDEQAGPRSAGHFPQRRNVSMFNTKPPIEYDSDRDMNSGGASRFFYCPKPSKSERNKGLAGMPKKQKVFNGQSQRASREMKDVEKRFTTEPAPNAHPTVKPVLLMRYLVRLVTPKGGLVLDPFFGSGTTGIACVLEDMHYVGIEKDPQWKPIAEKRIEIEGRQQRIQFE